MSGTSHRSKPLQQSKREDRLDEGLELTFPASDPPATGGASKLKGKSAAPHGKDKSAHKHRGK
jgi:hypothetical protein